MKLYTVLLIHLALLITTQVPAQNVGIATTTPHSSAALDVQSTSKGVSFPSMTSAQRQALPNPKAGCWCTILIRIRSICMMVVNR
jgi:hypothetical protein